MTTDVATPTQTHTVAGTGPYALLWPYGANDITAFVLHNGAAIALVAGTDFTVSPTEADTSGNLTLSAGAAATHFGRTLMIERATLPEQGWAGATARERGLEAQLDAIMREVQDIRARSARSLRLATPAPPAALTPGGAVLWSGTAFVPGPTADQIASAQDDADRAEAARDRAEAMGIFDTVQDLMDYGAEDFTRIVPGREYRAAGYSFLGLNFAGPAFPASPYIRPGRDWAYAGQWGAVGDGNGNDGDALNAALSDWAWVKGEPGAVYRCTETVTIKSNRRFAFNGAMMRRGAYGTLAIMQWLLQTERATTTWDASNIILEDVNVEDEGAGTRGQGVLLIGDNIKVRGYRLKFTAPYDGIVGAWSNYISGNNITIGGDIDVDTTAAGLWSDCFHLGYVKNFVLGAHNCRGGDDAIALFGTARSYSWRGRDLPAENITILPGYSESLTSHAIRIGAQGYFSPVENEGPTNLVFKNVAFLGETIGNPTYTPITLDDFRAPAFISGRHDNISIKATVADQTAALRILSAFGNPDVFNAANRAQHNFGRVKIEVNGLQATPTGAEAAQLIYGGGIDDLRMTGDLVSEIAGTGTLNQITLRQIDDFTLSGVRIKSDTTGSLFNSAYLRRIFLNDCEIGEDGQNEFATFSIALNADQATSVYIRGGRITATDRAFNITGTGLMGDFHLQGTVVASTFSAQNLPSFTGVTGWSGSVILDPAIGIRTTVAGLPGAGVPVAQGCRAVVTDANAITPGGIVAGGGANIVPVFRDGTNWRIG